MSAHVRDGRVLVLIQAFLKQGILKGIPRRTPIRGTPRGSVVKPFLANLYLHGSDAEVSRQG